MRVYKDIEELPPFKNGVLTIGSFDGVHLGHQKIIGRIKEIADKIDGESILITFHPHPRSIVQNSDVRLLSPLNEKLELLEKQEVSAVVVVHFTRDFSEQSPDEYLQHFLYNKFKPHTIVIGYDHKFGKNRAGDINLLKEASKERGYKVEEISKQVIEDISVSSTKIRNALFDGKIEIANELLGMPYALKGIVVRGDQLGRQIGFPTANIRVEDATKLIPKSGVYAVQVKLKTQNDTYNGMLNIGTRPTVNGTEQTIEVNIFDFDDNIYGEEMSIDLLKYLRAEQKFLGLAGLVEQLHKDKKQVLELLKA